MPPAFDAPTTDAPMQAQADITDKLSKQKGRLAAPDQSVQDEADTSAEEQGRRRGQQDQRRGEDEPDHAALA